MQLTRAADYAVRVMIHLASQPEGTVISKTLLAKAAEAPESFLSKILQALARGGLIRAQRGVVGGFSLLPRGARASLLDVVENIDGPFAINVCLASDGSCQRYSACAVHEVWRQAQSAMLSVLREAKIAEMVPAPGLRPAPLLARTSNAAEIIASGNEKSSQPPSPACLPGRPSKAQAHTAADGGNAHHTQEKI